MQVNFWYSGYDIIELKGIFENTFNFIIFRRKERGGRVSGPVLSYLPNFLITKNARKSIYFKIYSNENVTYGRITSMWFVYTVLFFLSILGVTFLIDLSKEEHQKYLRSLSTEQLDARLDRILKRKKLRNKDLDEIDYILKLLDERDREEEK